MTTEWILTAILVALVLVVEGLMPFLAPRAWRETFRKLTEMSDGQIRFIGGAVDYIPATIFSGCGRAASSRCLAYGIGTSAEQTRATGASRS